MKAIVGTVAATVLAILLPVSCSILEDLDPCPRGLRVRFVYDYNMEGADAFASQVDCYTLYVYDKDGKFLNSFTETGEKLRDENYRLDIDLPHGDYQLVAYGGIACPKSSFQLVKKPVEGDSRAELKAELLHKSHVSDQLLHDFYFGAADVSVIGELYNEVSIKLMKNTNNFRILLQQMNGQSVPVDKFEFCIEDDNSLFDAGNNLVPNGKITYLPWTKGVAVTRASTPLSAAYAEFSTSRLVDGQPNRLVVRRVEDQEIVIDVPLNEYLLLLKSEKYAEMPAQEFLDRQSNWSMAFFLDSKYKWINTKIDINGWTVRLNDVEGGDF